MYSHIICRRVADQACASDIDNEIFKQTDVQVIGISSDPVPKQKRIVENQNLTVRFILGVLEYLVEFIACIVPCLERREARCPPSISSWQDSPWASRL